MLAVTLVVVVIAQPPDVDRCEPGLCGGPAMLSAFQQAVQRVLGAEARVQTELTSSDPSDVEAASKARNLDGVVELSFSPEGEKARLHCYVARDQRWLDREISFGESRGSVRSEISERGRLLGFAVATMYAGDANEAPSPPPEAETQRAEPVLAPAPRAASAPAIASQDRPPPHFVRSPRRMAELGAIVSTGLGGTASGIGASAGFRWGLSGPVWARLFIAGRSGDIPQAQASTRTAMLGAGLALALLPESSSFELGGRLDAFASYFDVSHLSEDDLSPDRRSRWQMGSDLMAEAGYRVTPGAGAFVGAGLEAIFGNTEIYTHQSRAALVPPFRATLELGFRTRF